MSHADTLRAWGAQFARPDHAAAFEAGADALDRVGHVRGVIAFADEQWPDLDRITWLHTCERVKAETEAAQEIITRLRGALGDTQ